MYLAGGRATCSGAEELMRDDDATSEMHSGRAVGTRQFSDISQTDAANSIYVAPLDNLLVETY